MVASETEHGALHLLLHTHLVRDGTTHRGDQDDASSIPEPHHLPPCGLRSEQYSIRVDVHHLKIKKITRINTRIAPSSDSDAMNERKNKTHLFEFLFGVLQAIRVCL